MAGLVLLGPASLSPALAAGPGPAPAPVASAPSSTALPNGATVGGGALSGPGIVTNLAPGTPPPPVPKAVSWLVADLRTRQIIAARRVHTRLAPASTMKIFTALALAPRLDPATLYNASAATETVDGTKVGLVTGSRYTVDQLLHGLIMSSGNDCAIALGELAGGQAKAIALMQAEARSLGAFDTTVATTTGLDAAGQSSSAYDLALAGSAALQNHQLATIMKARQFNFPAAGKGLGKGRKHYSIQTHNKLIYNTPGATGVKNGYTVAARGSFVGSATRNGRSYIAVVLRTEGSSWHATDDLLEWAFASGRRAKPVGILITPAQAKAVVEQPAAQAAQPTGAGDAAAASAHVRGAAQAAKAEPSSLSGTYRALLIAALAGGLLALLAVLLLWSRRSAGRSASRLVP